MEKSFIIFVSTREPRVSSAKRSERPSPIALTMYDCLVHAACILIIRLATYVEMEGAYRDIGIITMREREKEKYHTKIRTNVICTVGRVKMWCVIAY